MIISNNKSVLFLICILLTANTVFSQSYSLTTLAGSGTGFSGDGGPATSASLFNPMAVCADGKGNFYIADWYNARVRMVNTAGIISTVAGTGIFVYNGDGGPAIAAGIKGPMGICTGKNGNMYICDIGSNRIRVINSAGIISTFAGNGRYGYSGDGGAATDAEFSDPAGICADDSGNIYVADIFNERVRKMNTAGIITTFAGNGIRGFTGNGTPATSATLYYPTAVAADHHGNLYIADADNSVIRKVNASGIIFTVAGTGVFGFSGDGGAATAAQLGNPSGVWVDAHCNIFVADGLENRIRRIDSSGIITTIAGTGKAGTTASAGNAAQALIDNPVGITGDDTGNIYFTNAFNQLVQKLTPLPPIHAGKFSITVYPNPGNGSFYFRITGFSTQLNVSIYDVLGQRVASAELTGPLTLVNLQNESSGIYLYRLTDMNETLVGDGKLLMIKH